ncbi:MAG TPA: glycosyltransferase [Candidatus Binataceae bacterium]|nr:glycosyltransferase [Candidatus Binataceae bacterium]
MDLSVILPVVNESANLRLLVPRLKAVMEREGLSFEIIVVDGGSSDGTPQTATELGARAVPERRRGYAGALETGFAEAQGDYVLTLDADLSHEPAFAAKLWRVRHEADIVIASRYVRGGTAFAGPMRMWLSRLLNLWMRRLLSMPVRDLSSGFRLYRRDALQNLTLEARNFEVIEEVLVKAYAQGYRILEVPFTYFPRESGRSHARLVRFGLDLMRSSAKLWKLRNSINSADYDERAFYSAIPLQRYWQRRRHRVTISWARGAERVLDAGCGSSVIIQSLNNAVGMDMSLGKLRFLRRRGIELVRGSAFTLPFRDRAFDCVISSQVIEHIPYDDELFREMDRVLRPGGTLIIGTPDYATLGWQVIEPLYGALMPGGYRDEHITHYTRESLTGILVGHGFVHEDTAYVARSELIMRFHKPGTIDVHANGQAADLSRNENKRPAAYDDDRRVGHQAGSVGRSR